MGDTEDAGGFPVAWLGNNAKAGIGVVIELPS